jgi:hypothetical protein
MMKSSNNSDTPTNLNCSSCDAILGTLDVATSSYKLFKLALSTSSNNDHRQSFDTSKWLSCHLLTSMDNQGLRKFVVTSDQASNPPLLVWLFTPDLNIASSATPQDTPLRVTKILWMLAPVQPQDARLDKQSMSEGEIEMPQFEFDALKRSLEQSAVLLPESARRFQEWNVALLERFTASNERIAQ